MIERPTNPTSFDIISRSWKTRTSGTNLNLSIWLVLSLPAMKDWLRYAEEQMKIKCVNNLEESSYKVGQLIKLLIIYTNMRCQSRTVTYLRAVEFSFRSAWGVAWISNTYIVYKYRWISSTRQRMCFLARHVMRTTEIYFYVWDLLQAHDRTTQRVSKVERATRSPNALIYD